MTAISGFQFATANRIIFGEGSAEREAASFVQYGRHCIVVTGKNADRASFLFEALKKSAITITHLTIDGEPSIRDLEDLLPKARDAKADFVISIGGGSVVDTGKAIAALATNHEPLLHYLEVVGDGNPLTEVPLPHVAIPTTAGTGSEVTKNAVLGIPEKRVKVSLRHEKMLPALSIVDPTLTYSLSPRVTASSGIDALIQLTEAYLSSKANPLTDGICLEGLSAGFPALIEAFDDGKNTNARRDMSIASLFGGLALANAGLGAVHGFAGPLGGMYSAGHGEICGALFASVLSVNYERMLASPEESFELHDRFTTLATIIAGGEEVSFDLALEEIRRLIEILEIPSLKQLGVKESEFPQIIEKAKRSSSMKGNPFELTDEELMRILRESF